MMLLLKVKQHKISSLSLISQQNLEKPENLLTFLQCLNSFSGLMGLLKKNPLENEVKLSIDLEQEHLKPSCNCGCNNRIKLNATPGRTLHPLSTR